MALSVSSAYKTGLEKINGRLLGSHQHSGVKWMLSRELDDNYPIPKGGLLADDCGCGKTYITTCLLAGHRVKTTLVVTVVSVLHQWRDILTSFGRMSPLIVSGSDCCIMKVPDGTNVVLTTYSIFTPKSKKKNIPNMLYTTAWDRVVLDEGHAIKNPNSTTFMNINRLNARIKWILSATPVQNSLNDIRTLAKWIGWSADLDAFISTKMLRRTLNNEGILNPRLRLPDLDSNIVRLQFSLDEEHMVYNNIESEYKTRIENTENGVKLYTEALEGILRCRQACCHYHLLEDKKGMKRKLDGTVYPQRVKCSTKFAFICDDIEKNPKEKCLVFCMWTKEIELLLHEFQKRNIMALKFDGSMTKEKRENTLYNFRETTIRVLVIQIQSGGVGLNLQCATRVYITSPTWNPTHEIQAICRSHRLGQDHIVSCFRLIIENTIEERIIDIQNKKMSIISDALDDRDLLKKLCDMEDIDICKLFT